MNWYKKAQNNIDNIEELYLFLLEQKVETDELSKQFDKNISEMSQDDWDDFGSFVPSHEFEFTGRMFYPLKLIQNPRLVRFTGSELGHRGHGIENLYKTRRHGVPYIPGPFGFAFLADSPEADNARKYKTYGEGEIYFTVPQALEVIHLADQDRQIIYDVREVQEEIAPFKRSLEYSK